MKTVLRVLARAIDAHLSLAASDVQNPRIKWLTLSHLGHAEALVSEILAGGCIGSMEIDLDTCTPTRIKIRFCYHNLSDHGHYMGATEHMLLIRATLTGATVRVTRCRDAGIRDYLEDFFYSALHRAVPSHLEFVDLSGGVPSQVQGARA